jgi:hypothetical protein
MMLIMFYKRDGHRFGFGEKTVFENELQGSVFENLNGSVIFKPNMIRVGMRSEGVCVASDASGRSIVGKVNVMPEIFVGNFL